MATTKSSSTNSRFNSEETIDKVSNEICNDEDIDKLIEENVEEEEEEIEPISKYATLKEIIEPNTYLTYGYVKYHNPNHILKQDEKPTGGQFDFTRCRGLAIVDVDINKSLNDNDRTEIRKKIIDSLKGFGVAIVQTPHGGLHIYCRDDGKIQFKENRSVKCASIENADFDIFVSVKPNKKGTMGQKDLGSCAGVTAPETKIKFYDSDKPNEIHEYKFIVGGWDSIVSGNLSDILSRLGITSKVIKWIEDNDTPKTKPSKPQQKKTYTEEELDFNAILVNGLEDIKVEVHNTKHSGVKIDKELTLFDLVVAIKDLDKESIECATEIIQKMNLTAKANEKFNRNFIDKLDDDKIEGNVSYLQMIIKTLNPEYYNKYVKPELDKKHNKFDPTQPIEYIKGKDIICATSFDEKIFILCQGLRNCSKLQCWLSFIDDDVVSVLKDEEVKRLLKCYFQGNKIVSNIYNILMVKTYSPHIKTISFKTLFTGWKFANAKKSERYDTNIKEWRDCVLNNTFGGNEEVYKYAMTRMSFILNNPGAQSKVALILKGVEGTGKNFFCDCMAKLTEGFSNPNAELSKITSRFNFSTFAKVYVAANEALDSSNKLAELEYIKKAVERPTMDFERKGLETISAENNLNLDITSNNDKPVLVSPTDRRFVVVKSSSKCADDKEYWSFYFDDLLKRENFYEDLFIYITTEFEYKNFLSLSIPETDTRFMLQLSCITPPQRFIMDNIEEFISGVSRDWIYEECNKLNSKGKYSYKGFVEAVMNMCEREKITHGKDKGCMRYFVNDKLQICLEKLSIFEKEDDVEPVNMSPDDLKKDEEEIAKYVEGLIVTNKDFDYILSRDIEKNKKAAVETYLQKNNWKFATTLSRKLKIRGWKKNKPQTA